MAKMKPIPLFGSGVQSYSQVVTAQRRLNCFYDIRTDGDKSELILRGTPGTELWVELSSNIVRGWRVVRELLYVVCGSVLYEITAAGATTNRGTIANGTNFVSVSDNGTQLIIVDGDSGYIFTFAASAFQEITDGNFPFGATTVAFINGRFIANLPNSRQFYVSETDDGLVWTPAIFAAKENSSDDLLAVEVLNGALILWGGTSMEFWQDEGTAPVPYQRINGASQTWGIAAVWSRAPLSNSVVFLGQNPQGTVQVLKLNGYQPVPISTSDIDNILNRFITDGTGVSDAVALTYMLDGHPMYQLTLPSGGRSFLYDDASKIWQEVQTGLGLSARHFADLGIVFNSLNYVSDYASGAIYQLSSEAYTDNGTAIKRQFRSKHIRNSGNPFSIDDLYIDMETGVGLQSGQGENPQVMLQVSKDGGRTFGQERWKSIGRVGQYSSPRVLWNRFGQAVDFVFQITMTDPVKFVVTSAFASSADEEAVQNGG